VSKPSSELTSTDRPLQQLIRFDAQPAGEDFDSMHVEALLPPRQAVFATVFKFAPKARARNVASAATRLQMQLDELNRMGHPLPYRKPFLSPAPHGAILLAIENVHFTQADADANSLSWAWQIAHQAELSELDWDVQVVAAQQLTEHR